MKTSHLQSLIALNANRITKKHNAIENALAQAKQFKLVHVAPAYRKHIDAMVKTAYNIVDKTRDELKKAVELQKELQAELRANRAAERAAKAVARFFGHEDGKFANDAFYVELTTSGEYIVHREDGTSRPAGSHWNHNLPGVIEHVTRPVAVGYQAPGVYSIDRDGQPKKDGVYEVLYSWHSVSEEKRLFKDGKWTMPDGTATAFGNWKTQGERYIVK